MNHRPSIVAAGLILALGLTASASAAPRSVAVDPPPQRAVRIDDLDLGQRSEVAKLYQRFVVAADRVCPAVVRDLARRAPALACRRQALDHAVARANLAPLTAFHRARGASSHRRVASL